MRKLLVLLSITMLPWLLTSCGKDNENEIDGGGEDINVLDKITDPKFKEYILRFIDNGKIVTASPDRLTAKEAAALERLDIYRWGIKDFTGIEYFTGLTYLDCSNNPLSVLNLSKNTKLETLRCNECTLTSLIIDNCRELKTLQCWINKLESINISNCLKLSTLECYDNELKALDLSKNNELITLDCCNNNISGVMDISHSKMIVLRTSHNPITAMKLNTALERLTCVMDDLSELDLSKCTNLLKIMCTRNPKMLTLDITNNRKLIDVDCGGISTEPAITLYVWWDVPADNMWGNRPQGILIGVGANGKLVTKRS